VTKCPNRKWGERCHCERCERRRASRRRNGGHARRPVSMAMSTSFSTTDHSSASTTRSGGTVAPLAVNGDFYASASAASQSTEVQS